MGEGKDVVLGFIHLEPTLNGSPCQARMDSSLPHLANASPPQRRVHRYPSGHPRPRNASLFGCSIMITDHPNDDPNSRTGFQVFHDRRENASLLYNV